MTGDPQRGSAYDDVQYPGFAYPQAHPDRLATLGRLFGLQPAPVTNCRVLELGCGDGGNLLPMAVTMPGSEFIGVDAAERPVARGSALAASAGLDNVTLKVLDIEALPDLGRFDYVIAHGVYSWVPPRTRGALLEVCRSHTHPDAIAYISYNAYPGSHLRDMAREILEYHLRGVSAPIERVQRAHELMRGVISAEIRSPFARALHEQMQRLLEYSDWLLLHDDLARVCTPFYFHEFMEHASAHGLQFLSEADLRDSQLPDLPSDLVSLLTSLPDDVVVREQYLDFITNRMFRQTVLCHREVTVNRTLDPWQVTGLVIASPAVVQTAAADEPAREVTFVTPRGSTLTTSQPLIAAALDALSEAWPSSLSFAELGAAAARRMARELLDGEEHELRGVLLEAYVAGVVQLGTHAPPVTATVAARPQTSPLTRAQLQHGATTVVSLRHANLELSDGAERRLLGLLDGTRDRAALAQALKLDHRPGGESAPPEAELDIDLALGRLAKRGLLQGTPEQSFIPVRGRGLEPRPPD